MDDEKNIVASLKGILTDEGYEVVTTGDGLDALEIIHSDPPDLVLLDIWLPGIDGIEVLKTVRTYHPEIEVLIMSGHGTIDTAVKATKLGAHDFFEKPFSIDQLIQSIEQALKLRKVRGPERNYQGGKTSDLPMCFEIMGGVRKSINKAIESSRPVLILGETGTGKEIIARAIHKKSKDAHVPFLKVNCLTRPMANIQDELFIPSRKSSGKLKEEYIPQDNKVLYLKNIEALSKKLQERLAGVLKREDSKSKSNFLPSRLFISTTKNLEELVRNDQFNAELFEEIKPLTTEIPTLREYSSNIPAIARNYLREVPEEEERENLEISDEALDALSNYDWPQNMKELKAILDRLIREVPSGEKVSLNHLPMNIRKSQHRLEITEFDQKRLQKEAAYSWEKEMIIHHLRKNDWAIDAACRSLKIDKITFQEKLDQLNIKIPDSKAPHNKGRQLLQRTLKRSVVLCGRGLHSGLKTGLILQPLPPGSGIIFGDISSGATTPAKLSNVHSTDYSTCLKKDYGSIATIEHIMAVLHMYRITNLLIKIGEEVPVMDGSAKDFCELIEDGEFDEQDELYEEIVIDRHYSLKTGNNGDTHISIEPSDDFIVSYHMEYPEPIGVMDYTYHFKGEKSFKEEIAPARTFGFLKDVAALTKMGFATGGKLDNFILLGDKEVLNTELRFQDEFVRHKILDIIGDLYLLGKPLRGHVKAHKSGHTQNIGLLRKIEDHLAKSAV